MGDGTKSIFLSKTFWGAVISIVAMVAARLGHPIAAQDQASLIEDALTLATVGGGLTSIYGRMTATTTIKPLLGSTQKPG